MTLFEPRPSAPRRSPDDPLATSARRDHTGPRTVGTVLGIVAAIIGVVVLVVGPAHVVTSARQLLLGGSPPLAADLVTVADRSFLTVEGRALLVDSRARLVDRNQITQLCPLRDAVAVLGCYSPLSGIVIYQPVDARLADTMVTTLAHEMLHAAYAELGTGEVFEINDMLDAAIAQLPADDPVHAQIAMSMAGAETSRDTETFAYLGSQIYPEGGFAPELEAVFARFIVDRTALVGVYRTTEGVVAGAVSQLQIAADQLAADEAANGQSRAQWEADRAAHDAARREYNIQADQYNSIPESERAGWTSTWTMADGTTVTSSLGDSLAARLAELDAYRVQLDARSAQLQEAETAAGLRRAQIDAQWADTVALLEAAYPGQTFG